jgi:choline dehydrogenase-like flavoprotein
MPLPLLVPSATSADFDVQDTSFAHDVVGRYVCNNWAEIAASQAAGGYPFDAVVIGAGMFGGYCAEKLFRLGAGQALRILVIEAGAYLLPSHIQNLPRQLGGRVGGADNLRTNDTGTQNVVWGMPWVSNEGFPGLAYCIGGRSLFWGGWSPRLTAADLASWPAAIRDYLTAAAPGAKPEYQLTEEEIGVSPSTDYIVKAKLYNALLGAFTAAPPPEVTEVTEAPLAVQGASPGSGLFPFDKFSSVPFLVDAIRTDVAANSHHGDVSRRIFLLPRTQVLRLNTTGTAVTSLDLRVEGQPQTLPIPAGCPVVIANGTVEATRLVLSSFGVGSTTNGSPRVGNLMAHLRSNITVRIKRSALGLAPPTPNGSRRWR